MASDPLTAVKGSPIDSFQNEYSESEASILNGKPETVLKIAHRKVNKRLLLWYYFVYLIMRIHVSNITNTAIINLEQGTGIKKQLGNLTIQRWPWALSIF